jgi:hypothetical protein
MYKAKEKLLEAVLLTLKDAKKQFANHQIGKDAFKKYKHLVVTKSIIYDNHLGNNYSFEKLEDRFILETAILHGNCSRKNWLKQERQNGCPRPWHRTNKR